MREYYNSEISAAIDEVVHSERDRAIMKRRLCDRILQEPLAEEFDLSVTRIQQIIYKEKGKIFKWLRKYVKNE